MQVDFYHLTRVPLERALPSICEKVLASGGRLLIVAAENGLRASLDRLLWTYAADSFLPHAQRGTGQDGVQPILLSPDIDAANGARNIALADGEWREDALDFERTFFFFDEARKLPARAVWKMLKARDDVRPRYWRHNDRGRWEEAG